MFAKTSKIEIFPKNTNDCTIRKNNEIISPNIINYDITEYKCKDSVQMIKILIKDNIYYYFILLEKYLNVCILQNNQFEQYKKIEFDFIELKENCKFFDFFNIKDINNLNEKNNINILLITNINFILYQYNLNNNLSVLKDKVKLDINPNELHNKFNFILKKYFCTEDFYKDTVYFPYQYNIENVITKVTDNRCFFYCKDLFYRIDIINNNNLSVNKYFNIYENDEYIISLIFLKKDNIRNKYIISKIIYDGFILIEEIDDKIQKLLWKYDINPIENLISYKLLNLSLSNSNDIFFLFYKYNYICIYKVIYNIKEFNIENLLIVKPTNLNYHSKVKYNDKKLTEIYKILQLENEKLFIVFNYFNFCIYNIKNKQYELFNLIPLPNLIKNNYYYYNIFKLNNNNYILLNDLDKKLYKFNISQAIGLKEHSNLVYKNKKDIINNSLVYNNNKIKYYDIINVKDEINDRYELFYYIYIKTPNNDKENYILKCYNI